MKKVLSIVFLAGFAVLPQGVSAYSCDHDAYPVSKIESGNAEPNVRSTAFARNFKTAITSRYKPVAEFSGHYNVVSWGCGSQCHQFAIVDTLTGKVFEVPEPSIGYDDYRVNSRLFVTHAPSAIDKNDPFSKLPKNGFYLWDEDQESFKKLKRCDAS